MCERYYRRWDKQKIAESFHTTSVFAEPMVPDFNVAPTTFQPAVRLSRDTGERELVLMRWGMVPFFASTLAEFKGISTANARTEILTTSATWRESFKKRRCIIPADGFYEWKTLGEQSRRGSSKGKRQPYAISRADGKPMGFAGLWDAWKEPKKSPQQTDTWLQSFAIVTTEANELISTIHPRMPVILDERDWEEWLAKDEATPPVHLLRPFESEWLRLAPCNPAVGNVKNNGPEMLNSA